MKTLKYLKFSLLILIPALLIVLPCYGQENDPSTDEYWDNFANDFSYPGLKSIESFGSLAVIFTSIEEEKKGLDKKALTKYLKFKYMNNFAGLPYKDASSIVPSIMAAMLRNEHKKAEKLKSELKNIGGITVKVSVIGDDRSRIVAYHVELNVKSITPDPVALAYSNAILGLCMEKNLEKQIKDAINSLIQSFAFTFFDVKGKL